MRHLYRLHAARYHFAAAEVVGKSVLDVACGAGYGARILADAGALAVVGVDNSAQAIEYAKARYPGDNIHYMAADAAATGLADHSIDVAVSFETIEHLPLGKIEAFLGELRRVLKPDGRAFISTPNKELSYRSNPYHTVEFDLAEFESLLRQHFPAVTFYGQRGIGRWYLTMMRKLERWPGVWSLDGGLRAIFYSRIEVLPLPLRRGEPMFFVARCECS